MKYFAYLSLLGLASTQDISPMGLELEDEEAQNLLDVSMSRWASDRLRNKSREVEMQWREIRNNARIVRPNTSDYGFTMEQINDMSKDIFGWTPEAKYKTVKPKYAPLVKSIAQSKELKEFKDHQYRTFTQDPLAMKIRLEAMDLKNAVFGGHGTNGYTRSRLEGDRFRHMPTDKECGEECKNLGQYRKEILKSEGAHIDNYDIKDIFEDASDLMDDVEDFVDPKYAPTAKGIKLDAALRWSPNVQKMFGMIADDLNIHNERELNKVASKIGEKLENSTLLQKMRKTIERLVRSAIRDAKIGDLPNGKRMKIVNRLTEGFVENYQKSRGAEQNVRRDLRDQLRTAKRELVRYFQKIDKLERSMK